MAALALACLASVIPTAEGSYPGRNGRIAYLVVEDASPTASFWTETVLPNGRGRRKLGDFGWVSWAASGRLLAGSTLTWIDGLPGGGAVLADHRGLVLRTIPPALGPDGLPLFFAPAALSPDGRTVAFVNSVVHPYAQPEQVVDWIWTMRTDGTRPRRLARGTKPRWTPDGRRIVFQREDAVGGYNGIASMRADGRFKRQLIDRDAAARFLDLAPDGRRLLWWGSRREGSRRNSVVGMFTSDLRGRHPRLISRRNPQGDAAWSPDGTKIVFVVDDVDLQGTFIASASGGQRRRLLRQPRFGLSWQPRPRQ